MQMTIFRDALVAWLGVFELLAGAGGIWGVSWLGRRQWGARALLAPLSGLALVRLARRGRRGWAALALALPCALALQIGASSLRNHRLNPRALLLPGAHPGRRVERVEIALAEGAVPALHIVPEGGARAALCVAHGSGCDKTFYIWRLADALLEAGVAVLLIDLDGHGENARAQRFPEMLECIAGPVGWLRARYTSVALLGYSLGACLAARAVADGLRVEALALLEGPPTLAFGRREMLREGLLLLRPGLWHMARDSSLFHIVRAWSTTPIRAAISTWDLIDALDLRASVSRIAAPLLVAYGGRDAIVPPRQGEQVRAALPPQAEFLWVPRASHLSLVLEPELLAALVGWLGRVLRPA
jgi:pimeloyl-ACP methyl ester carboxylesterase